MKEKVYETMQKLFRRYRTSEENLIDYETVKAILKNDKEAILVDVRSKQEYQEEHLEGSINCPLYDLERNSQNLSDKKENTIIVYCQSGSRSKRATQILKERGCFHVYQIEGGFDNICKL